LRRISSTQVRPRPDPCGVSASGVIVNDVPTWRIDHMPYGGVKDSGVGRKGPRYTIEEMTEPKLLVINTEIA